jgi:hypothetical protein
MRADADALLARLRPPDEYRSTKADGSPISLWTASPEIGLQNMNTMGYQTLAGVFDRQVIHSVLAGPIGTHRLRQEQGQCFSRRK